MGFDVGHTLMRRRASPAHRQIAALVVAAALFLDSCIRNIVQIAGIEVDAEGAKADEPHQVLCAADAQLSGVPTPCRRRHAGETARGAKRIANAVLVHREGPTLLSGERECERDRGAREERDVLPRPIQVAEAVTTRNEGLPFETPAEAPSRRGFTGTSLGGRAEPKEMPSARGKRLADQCDEAFRRILVRHVVSVGLCHRLQRRPGTETSDFEILGREHPRLLQEIKQGLQPERQSTE